MTERDHDRYLIASTLFAQAVSNTAALSAVMSAARTSKRSRCGDFPQELMAGLRDDLIAQAEHYRHLMALLRPATTNESSIAAGLEGDLLAIAASSRTSDDAAPVAVTVCPDLSLDWSTEIVVRFIVQRILLAPRDVPRSEAMRVVVTPGHGSEVDIDVILDPSDVVEMLATNLETAAAETTAMLYRHGVECHIRHNETTVLKIAVDVSPRLVRQTPTGPEAPPQVQHRPDTCVRSELIGERRPRIRPRSSTFAVDRHSGWD